MTDSSCSSRCAHRKIHKTDQSTLATSADGNSIPDLREFKKKLLIFWQLVQVQNLNIPTVTWRSETSQDRKNHFIIETYLSLFSLQVKGHSRTGSDSKAFIEATKRDALLLLESELRKLVDSAPAPEKERTRVEFNGFTELFKRYLFIALIYCIYLFQ